MTPLKITLTDAGLAALVNRPAAGTNAVVVTHVGLTAGTFVVSPTLTALPGEFKRLGPVSGVGVDAQTIHCTAQDSSQDSYTVRGFGLLLGDGTLLGVYCQAEPIFGKSAVSTFMLALDIRFAADQAARISFGDASFTYPPASESRKGVAEIAAQAEVDGGGDDERIVTSLKLSRKLTPLLARKVETVTEINGVGLISGGSNLTDNVTLRVTQATAAEAIAGERNDRAVTPLSLGAALARIVDGSPPALDTLGKIAATLTRIVDGSPPALDTLAKIAAAVSRIVDGSPPALDTLDKIAAAIGDDPIFAQTVTELIATKTASTRRITGAGLAKGGGDLLADIVLTVLAATTDDIIGEIVADKAITPAALAGLPKSRANNGFVVMPGNVNWQWGRFTAAGNGVTSILFPFAFGSACFSVVQDGGVPSGIDSKDNPPIIIPESISRTGFQVFSADDNVSQCLYQAIGG